MAEDGVKERWGNGIGHGTVRIGGEFAAEVIVAQHADIGGGLQPPEHGRQVSLTAFRLGSAFKKGGVIGIHPIHHMDGANDKIQPQPADGLPSCLGGGGILHAHLRPPSDGERGIIRQQGLKLPVPGGDVRRGQARAVEVHVVGEADLL